MSTKAGCSPTQSLAEFPPQVHGEHFHVPKGGGWWAPDSGEIRRARPLCPSSLTCKGICPMFTSPVHIHPASLPLPISQMRKTGFRVAAQQLCKLGLTQDYLLLVLLGEVLNTWPPPSGISPSGRSRPPGLHGSGSTQGRWALWAGENGEQTGRGVLSLYLLIHSRLTTRPWCRASCPGHPNTAPYFVTCDLDTSPSPLSPPSPLAGASKEP